MKFEVTGRADAPVAIVLSAGLGGAAAFWQPQLPALEAHFRVLQFDQRGTGRNRQALSDPYSIGHMTDDVLAIMDTAGIAAAHFIGHALGGLIGLDLARRHPERLARLVVVNAWAKVDPHTERCFDIRLGILHAQGPAAYVAAQPIFLHTAPYLSADQARVAAEVAHGTAQFQGTENLLRRIAALRGFDARADLARIRTKTLVAASRDDLLVPWTASRALAAGLPQATLWVTPEGGHACTVEQPATFNAAMLKFLLAAD